MEDVMFDLAAALRERISIICYYDNPGNPEKHMARLQTVSAKIDKLQAALPPSIDPRLAHYLQRRSYEKALELLEGM